MQAAAVQPYKPPKPNAKPSEDRHVFQNWESPNWEGMWTFTAVFDGALISISRMEKKSSLSA